LIRKEKIPKVKILIGIEINWTRDCPKPFKKLNKRVKKKRNPREE